jgi:vacuolar-type H+-ATPase subunit E/Vma4
MALEQISQAVLDTARTEADHIIRAAEKAAAAKVDEARRAAEQEGERRYQAAVRAIEEDFARKLIQAKGAAGKELLAKKNGCVRRVFDEACEAILSLPRAEYAQVARGLLERSAGSCGGRLRFHPQDRDLFAEILAAFNKTRTADTRVEPDDSNPLAERGGFIFVGGSFQVDQTIGTLLADLERDMAPEIASELFGA